MPIIPNASWSDKYSASRQILHVSHDEWFAQICRSFWAIISERTCLHKTSSTVARSYYTIDWNANVGSRTQLLNDLHRHKTGWENTVLCSYDFYAV